MTIKGLSDRRQHTRLGHIRIGEKKENSKGVEYPSKLDYFKPDFTDPELQAQFTQLYGSKPKSLTIAFPGDDPDVCFPQHYKCYGSGSGLKCKGNGERAARVINAAMATIPCPGPQECEFGSKHGCKQVASLQFFIKGVPVLQIAQLNTSSYNSIVNLNSGIDMLRMARGGRTIAGVWVQLDLVEQEAQPGGKKVKIFVLQLRIPVSLDEVQQLTSAVDVPMALPAPDETRDPLLDPVSGFNPDPDTSASDDSETDGTEGYFDYAAAPEVKAAFKKMKTSKAKQKALVKSASEGGWPLKTLVDAILANGGQKPDGQKSKAATKAPEPTTDEADQDF